MQKINLKIFSLIIAWIIIIKKRTFIYLDMKSKGYILSARKTINIFTSFTIFNVHVFLILLSVKLSAIYVIGKSYFLLGEYFFIKEYVRS